MPHLREESEDRFGHGFGLLEKKGVPRLFDHRHQNPIGEVGRE